MKTPPTSAPSSASSTIPHEIWAPAELVRRVVEGENPVRVSRTHRGMTARSLAVATRHPELLPLCHRARREARIGESAQESRHRTRPAAGRPRVTAARRPQTSCPPPRQRSPLPSIPSARPSCSSSRTSRGSARDRSTDVHHRIPRPAHGSPPRVFPALNRPLAMVTMPPQPRTAEDAHHNAVLPSTGGERPRAPGRAFACIIANPSFGKDCTRNRPRCDGAVVHLMVDLLPSDRRQLRTKGTSPTPVVGFHEEIRPPAHCNRSTRSSLRFALLQYFRSSSPSFSDAATIASRNHPDAEGKSSRIVSASALVPHVAIAKAAYLFTTADVLRSYNLTSLLAGIHPADVEKTYRIHIA